MPPDNWAKRLVSVLVDARAASGVAVNISTMPPPRLSSGGWNAGSGAVPAPRRCRPQAPVYPHRGYMARDRSARRVEARKDNQMIRRPVLTIGAAAPAALVTVTACSSGNQAATSSSTSAGTSAASSSAPVAQAHNQADVTFAQDMIPHHQQAVQMSDIILGKQGIDPRVVQLANQIKAA